MNQSASLDVHRKASHHDAFLNTKNGRYFAASPKSIVYNSFISEGSLKSKGKYRLRNCRQPELTIKDESSPKLKSKFKSYLDLKELTKQKIQQESVKKRYDKYCEEISDHDIIDKLRTQLKFFPSPSKNPQKIKYKQNIKNSQKGDNFNIKGTSFVHQIINDPILEQLSKNLQIELDQEYFQQQQRYRQSYISKWIDRREKQPIREEIISPLTGWR